MDAVSESSVADTRAGLAVTFENDVAGVTLARAFGALDLTTTPKLDRELEAAFGAGQRRVLILDLNGITFLDATGVCALWTLRHWMRELGGKLVLRAPSAAVVVELVAMGLVTDFDIE